MNQHCHRLLLLLTIALLTACGPSERQAAATERLAAAAERENARVELDAEIAVKVARQKAIFEHKKSIRDMQYDLDHPPTAERTAELEARWQALDAEQQALFEDSVTADPEPPKNAQP